MGIKLGNIEAKYIKVGGADCSIYLGDTKLYPSEEPISKTYAVPYGTVSGSE